jgi:predicted P-loop ATPase
MCPRINPKLDQIGDFKDKNIAAKYVCRIIDQSIHRSYEIFEVNYIAYDMLNNTEQFKRYYTDEQRKAFEEYLHNQLAKIDDVGNITEEEHQFMVNLLLVMYSNPLKNKLRTILGDFN